MPETTGAGPDAALQPRRASPRWLAAAVLVGLALRLAFGFGYWVDKPLTLDEQEYLLLARNLARGHGFAYPPVSADGEGGIHFERPPVYPAVIAATLVATGHPWATARGNPTDPVPLPRSSSEVPRAVIAVQACLGALGVWLIGLLASRTAGPRAGVLAASIAAVHPPLVWVSGYVLNEPLYSMLALLVAWLLMRTSAGPGTDNRGETRARLGRVGLALLAGAVAGLAALTKEGMLLFVPLAGLWLLARRDVATATALAVGVAVVLLPWVARNHAVHGRFVLTAAHGGVTFWTGNNALARGEGDLAANPEMKRARNALEASHPGLTAQEMDGIYYREALAFMSTRPLDWLALEAKKLFYTIVPIGPSYLLHSPRYRLGSWIPYALLVPFAIGGVIRLGRRASVLWPVLLMAASVVLMSLVFFPQERFRIPVVDPTLVICAACCAASRPARDPAGTAAR
jgi:4-amino-4-deoxy-L-arabinose transferase-like glycosyltransferase